MGGDAADDNRCTLRVRDAERQAHRVPGRRPDVGAVLRRRRAVVCQLPRDAGRAERQGPARLDPRRGGWHGSSSLAQDPRQLPHGHAAACAEPSASAARPPAASRPIYPAASASAYSSRGTPPPGTSPPPI